MHIPQRALLFLSFFVSFFVLVSEQHGVRGRLIKPPPRPPGPGPWPPAVCNPNERGPHLQARQQAALADWAVLFYENEDIIGSFDRWIPGQWINHSPNAEQGRDNAIQRLTTLFADPSVAMTPFNIFAGQGYGFVHFKFLLPSINVTFAAWHSFRFEGTCFVEHWDGVQRIFGNETNPIAFF
ncbi:hypothetical protein CC1G_08240 [Coprinopsis cinerea okayama7|uniref:SnoaL-like domain-containing protein n=1 Tax=Coprinopsis cinerea (strain Okayama-7 / 130 / ATCC MYA-4618 / FGSC 9003) TaxID=240176 RepID=A8P7J2_COPC7|nr:hypothetical protein CC1G_08240 [Coprinopsis cinerea okayama7\|eukprot:XP_001839373.1 hypothetical protein CC1G_08240 [Coprinopsis cinerea okayama7\